MFSTKDRANTLKFDYKGQSLHTKTSVPRTKIPHTNFCIKDRGSTLKFWYQGQSLHTKISVQGTEPKLSNFSTKNTASTPKSQHQGQSHKPKAIALAQLHIVSVPQAFAGRTPIILTDWCNTIYYCKHCPVGSFYKETILPIHCLKFSGNW